MPVVIKFKYEFSYSKIVFLELEIFKESVQLETNIHIKPTNKQLYLDYNSNHPIHLSTYNLNDSSWLIYLATCKKCRGQYVGKSQTVFKKRHSNHKREINKPNCAISSSFAVTYYTNVGLGLAGWLSRGLRAGEASHYFVVSI